jgi:hypothetical protein
MQRRAATFVAILTLAVLLLLLSVFALLQTPVARERVVTATLSGARFQSTSGWVPWGIVATDVTWDDAEGNLVLACNQVSVSLTASSLLAWTTVVWPQIECEGGTWISGNQSLAELMTVTLQGFLVETDLPAHSAPAARTVLQITQGPDRGAAQLIQLLFVWLPPRDFVVQSFRAERLVLRATPQSPIGTQIDVVGKARGEMTGLLDVEVTASASTGAHSGIVRLLRKTGEDSIVATLSWTMGQSFLGRVSIQGTLRASRAPFGCRSAVLLDGDASAVVGRVHTEGWDARVSASGNMDCEGVATVTVSAGDVGRLNASFTRAVEFVWLQLTTQQGTLVCVGGECTGIAKGSYRTEPPRHLDLCASGLCVDIGQVQGGCRAALLLGEVEIWVWRGSLYPFYTLSHGNEASPTHRASGMIGHLAVTKLAVSASYPKVCFVADQLGALTQVSGCAVLDLLAGHAEAQVTSSHAAAALDLEWRTEDSNWHACLRSKWGHVQWIGQTIRSRNGEVCGSLMYGVQKAQAALWRDEAGQSLPFVAVRLLGSAAVDGDLAPTRLAVLRSAVEYFAPDNQVPEFVSGLMTRVGMETRLSAQFQYTGGLGWMGNAAFLGPVVQGNLSASCLEHPSNLYDCKMETTLQEDTVVYSVSASRHFTP